MGWVENSGRDRNPFRGVAWNHVKQKKAGSKSFATDYEADAWWRAREQEITSTYADAGVNKTRQQRSIPTLAEFGRTVLRARDVEEDTYRTNSYAFEKQISLFWGEDVTIRQPDKLAVQRMFNAARQRGNGTSRRSQIRGVYSAVFDAAIDHGYRSDNPMRGVHTPQGPRQRTPRILTSAEVAAVQEAMPEWLSAAVLVMAHTGLRIGECCGLQAHNIDELNGELTVQHVLNEQGTLRPYPKGKEPLPVPMSQQLRRALAHHLKTYRNPNNPGFVFFNPKVCAPVRPASLRRWLYKSLVAAEIPEPHPTPHHLRHYTATTLARSGAEAYDIQTVLRHKHLGTSQGYIDAVPSEQRHRAVRVFDDPGDGGHAAS